MQDWKQISPPFPTGSRGSYVSGWQEANPIQISYYLPSKEENVLYAKLTFHEGAEGPPGHVHGGCQAAILDEVMGSTAWALGHKVVAKHMEVHFDHMIPIQQKCLARGEMTHIEGRKVFITAKLYQQDQIYAHSKALFIILPPEKIAKLTAKLKGL